MKSNISPVRTRKSLVLQYFDSRVCFFNRAGNIFHTGSLTVLVPENLQVGWVVNNGVQFDKDALASEFYWRYWRPISPGIQAG